MIRWLFGKRAARPAPRAPSPLQPQLDAARAQLEQTLTDADRRLDEVLLRLHARLASQGDKTA